MLLSVPVVFVYGLLILNRDPPPWLLQYRAWINGTSRFLQSVIGYATMVPLLVATLAALNLAFGFHPLGIDYRRPWTYSSAVIPLLVCDLFGRCFNSMLSNPKPLYSAVSDDWLLWENQSVANAKSAASRQIAS